jgi:hypothetical protein
MSYATESPVRWFIGNGPEACSTLHVNFHEKAIFVKADVAATMTVCVGYPCHASILVGRGEDIADRDHEPRRGGGHRVGLDYKRSL